MANLSNINNKFIVTDGGHVSIGATTTTYPLTVESGGVGTVLRAGTSFVSIDSVGSAASPSLIFNGDSNTGIWRPASDTLGFSTAGVERFKIGTSNALLIGTSYQLKFTTDDGSTQLGKLFDDVGFTVEGKINNNLNLRSLANSTGEGIKFQNKTGGVLSTHMFIGRLGNITIGNGETGLVFAKLCLSGDPYVVTSSGQATGGIDVRSNVNPGAGLYTGGISFGGASNGRAAISGVQGTSTDGDRQGLAFFTHSSGTGSADAAEAMRIATDGNVGIGTDAPGRKLEIKDEITTNGHIQGLRIMGNSGAYYDIGRMVSGPLSIQGSQAGYNDIVLAPTSGDVGIGTTGPDSKIQVEARNASNVIYAGFRVGYNATSNNYYDADTHHFRLGTGSSAGGNLYVGGGVYLGGTATANKLDDYEEGTWNVGVSSSGGNMTNIAFTNEKYTKIGNLVTYSFNLSGSFTSAATESSVGFNLPFTADSTLYKSIGSVSFFIGAAPNRFGVGSIFLGTTSATLGFIYIAGREVQQSGAWGDMRVTATFFAA